MACRGRNQPGAGFSRMRIFGGSMTMVVPGATFSVIQVLPPMTEPRPMVISPRIVAPA